MYIPFTYIVYCIPEQKYYYGVRFAKDCCPDDLWKTYFTSSKYVKALIKKHGRDAFVATIRKTFSDSLSAKKWEAKVLRRLNVVKRPDFINKYDFMVFDLNERAWINNGTISKFANKSDLDSYLEAGWNRGRLFTQSHKAKISEACRGHSKNVGRKASQSTRALLSQIQINRVNTRPEILTTKQIVVNGTTYDSIRAACAATGWCYHTVKKYGSIATRHRP